MASLDEVCAPRAERVTAPRTNEVVIFVAFFDMGLKLPSVQLVTCVLRLYGLELAQLTPYSFVKLGVFNWIMRSAGTSGEECLFMYLHDNQC